MSSIQFFLQSNDWLEFQESLGRKVFRYDQDGIKAGIIKLPLWFGRSYLYVPHGPAINFNAMIAGEQNPVRQFLQYLKELGKKEKAIFIKAEPLIDHIAQVLAEKKKFRRVKREIQPAKTVVIDLTLSEDELKEKMHHKTRYNIGVAERHGIQIRESNDLEAFWKLLKKTTKRDRFFSHPKEYYQKLLDFFEEGREIKVKLFLAYQENKPLAGAVILFYCGTAYYLYGASDYSYRQMMAPYLLHWKIIQELKQLGLAQYDWWGIDSRHWPGVTRFKLNWGGWTVEHPGSFDWRLSWWWYQAYKIARKIF